MFENRKQVKNLFLQFKKISGLIIQFLDLTEKNEVLNIALYFSKLKIFTLFINFEDPYAYKYYLNENSGKSRTQLPMNVIFFTTEQSFNKYLQMFDQIENKMSKFTYPTHDCLLIFMKARNSNEKPLLDFCTKPTGNPINLRFDSQLIVKCYDDPNIQEWYSLIKNETSVYDLATWDFKNGFQLKTNLSKYERRGGLKGKVVRIATTEVNIY